MTRMHFSRILLLLVPFLAGCQHTLRHRDWSKYDGPGKEHFLKEELQFERLIDDPVEPANRGISVFNHVILVGIVAPIGWVYRGVFPKPVRNGIENVFDNAYYPVRGITNLFQGKFGGAWDETKRFAVNTTVGILGIRDQASKWDIDPSKEDFGQTFGAWGWEDSSYFVFPVLGPTTVRDGIGKFPDALADPLTYYPPTTLVRSGTRLSNVMPAYKSFVRSNYDPYTLGRRLFVLNRELRIDDYVYEDGTDQSGETETLESVFLKPKDAGFPGKGKTYEVLIPTTGEELKYTLWRQPEPAPLIYFLPGTGGHRLGSSSTALAEAAYEHGNSIITISSAFNFEFIKGASSVPYPGFAPVDAHDIHVALDAIDRDVRERFPGGFTDARRLAGLSLGAMHTQFIAAQAARPDNDLMDFDVYLAVSSPVSLRYAVGQLDQFFNAPLAFPKKDRERQVEGILRKVIYLADDGDLQPGNPLPLSNLEAQFLIGFSFRLTLGDIIYQTTDEHPRGVLRTKRSKWKRVSAYQEIARYSFMEYFYAWALPYYAEQRDDIDLTEEGGEQLFELCDLRSIEAELAAHDRILYVSNRNDFLMRPEDIQWAERVYGDHALFFERGGHLGNLNQDDIRETFRDHFQDIWDPE